MKQENPLGQIPRLVPYFHLAVRDLAQHARGLRITILFGLKDVTFQNHTNNRIESIKQKLNQWFPSIPAYLSFYSTNNNPGFSAY